MAVLISVILAAIAPVTRAAITEEISSIGFEGPTVLLDSDEFDADPTTIRNGLHTNIEVTIARTQFGDPAVNSRYRVVYSLENDGGDQISLANGDPGNDKEVTTPVFLVVLNGGAFVLPNSHIEPITAAPDPLATLDPARTYRVVSRLEREIAANTWAIVDDTPATDTNFVNQLHFTNVASGDAEYNIRGLLFTLTWDQKFIVDTDAANDSLLVSATAVFGRYDEFDDPITTQATTVYFDFDLLDSSDNQVPLVGDGIVTAALSLDSYDASGVRKLPDFDSVAINDHPLQPVGQLDSVNESYRLVCTLRHDEDALANQHTNMSDQLAAETLLHFNGNLAFGTFQTQFTGIDNSPTPLGGGPTWVDTSILISDEAGVIPGNPNYVFGDGITALNVELLANGDARLPAAPLQSLPVFEPGNPGGDVTRDLGGIAVTYTGGVTLSPTGANAAGITIELPQGLGYIADRVANPFLGESDFFQVGPFALAPDLDPVGSLTFNLPANAAIFDESHPLVFHTKTLVLDLGGVLEFDTSDVDYIHDEPLEDLEAIPAAQLEDPATMRERFSNDLYLRVARTAAGDMHTWRGASDGSARMTGTLDLDPIAFHTHFPLGAAIDTPLGGKLVYDKGIPVSEASRVESIVDVKVPYNIDCPEDPCAGGGEVIVSQFPDGNALNQTPTGGLWRDGSVAATQLRWGARGDGGGPPPGIHPNYPYAHRTDSFTRSSFYMSGYQLYADDNATLSHPVYASQGGDHAAGVLLNAGFNDDTMAPDTHSVTESEYNKGEDSYPGLNFIVDSSGQTGASRLGGNTSDFTYELFEPNNACKYYIRSSGVSGRQVALNNSWSNPLEIYGFEFTFDSFQLSFIDSVPEQSWVDGSIEVSGYSNFTQGFTGLIMDCIGELIGADIDPNDLGDKSLTYWRSSFNPSFMAFSTMEPNPGTCPIIKEGILVLGIKTQVAHIPTTLNGVFGFHPNGNLATPADGFAGIDAAKTPITSELAIPATVPLDGPNQDWSVVSVGDLRFNNPLPSGHPIGSILGFVTWGATINVPYFNDLQVQCITSAPAGNSAKFHITPGWTEGGKTIFVNIDFDPSHKSWPIAVAPAVTLEDYKNNANPAWLVHATKKMFGFIPLDYPLKWDDDRRLFQAFEEQSRDFFVVETQHDVPYMDAKFLKIEFGAQYEGIPEFSIADVLNSGISKASEAMTEAVTIELKSAFDEAFEEFDKMLSDTMAEAFEPIIDAAAMEVVRPLYGTLQTSYDNSLGASRDGWTNGPLKAALELEIYKAGIASSLNDQLQEISDATNGAASFIAELQLAVEDMIVGIDSLANQVSVVGGVAKFSETLPPVGGVIRPGILYQESGEFQIVDALISKLLDKLLEPEIAAVIKPLLADAGSELNSELNALIEELRPAIEQITNALNQVRVFLVEIHGALAAGQSLVMEIDAIVQHAVSVSGDMDAILEPLYDITADLINDSFDSNGFAGGDMLDSHLNIFQDLSEDEFVALVKAELQDQLLQSGIVEQVQFMARQKLYDIQAKFSSTIQTTFTQVAEICKEVVSEAVGALDESIAPMLGDVSAFAGSGEITGYAEFNGDSLRKLRMDLEAQFQMPDEMKIHAFLEICVITSEDNPNGNACISPGEKLVEVRVGAIDVPFDWISDGLRCNLGVKVSLKDFDGDGGPDPPFPVGVSGCLELTGGEIDFQSFKITEFGVALAIGIDEAYIAAKARVEFSSYEMAAGIFFGRTCTPDPIRFCDPDVAALLTPGTTFSGVCIYGEVWIPLSQVILGIPPSCLFRVSAGVGAGTFVFLEGPTFGGSMLLGVSGEAICLVSIEGSIKMTGVYQGGSLKARGTGKFEACIGIAFIEICFDATVKMTYDNGDWDMDY